MLGSLSVAQPVAETNLQREAQKLNRQLLLLAVLKLRYRKSYIQAARPPSAIYV